MRLRCAREHVYNVFDHNMHQQSSRARLRADVLACPKVVSYVFDGVVGRRRFKTSTHAQAQSIADIRLGARACVLASALARALRRIRARGPTEHNLAFRLK